MKMQIQHLSSMEKQAQNKIVSRNNFLW